MLNLDHVLVLNVQIGLDLKCEFYYMLSCDWLKVLIDDDVEIGSRQTRAT